MAAGGVEGTGESPLLVALAQEGEKRLSRGNSWSLMLFLTAL